MPQQNLDIKIGLANGTRASVKKVVLKPNDKPQEVKHQGMMIPAVFASPNACVKLEREGRNNIENNTLWVKPKMHGFQADLSSPETL